MEKTLRIFTIGHSTHTLKDFIALLKEYEITHLVDVRSIPRSRHAPQFNEKTLNSALKRAKIKYTHLKELGGLRHTHVDSINTGWQNASFRGFADYMQMPEFEEGIDKLLKIAVKDQIAIMCAEAVPWRCHRSLISDVLLIKGVHVDDIFSKTSTKPHTLTSFAKIRNGVITYPGEVFKDTKENMKKTKITTLFIDVGGVLLTNGWDHEARVLASKKYDLDLKEMEARHHLTFDTYEVGKLTLEEYLHRIVFFKKRSFSMKEFQKFMFDQSKAFPEMIKLISTLKLRYNLKIAVVSNEGRELTEHRIRSLS